MNKSIPTTTVQKVFRILLGSAMVLAAIGHLSFQRAEFQAQVPNWLPFGKDLVVILSGLVELGLGLSMLFWKKQRVNVGIILALFYVLIFPGNIAQYLNGTNAFGLDTDQARLTRLFFQPVLILWALWSTGALKAILRRNDKNTPGSNTSFYDLEAIDNKGETKHMSDYKGKVILIVNTATKCGLAPQFEGLEALYQTYKNQEFVVLGFPSNQFANQEPDGDEAITQVCRINFGVTFPLFSKIEVNGTHEHPLFTYLKKELGSFPTRAIKWNFTKFLIDRNGIPVKRFSPAKKPQDIEADIKKLL